MTDRPFQSVLPPEFEARMRGRLGSEADRFFAALAEPPAGLRVNTLRIEPTAFERLSPFRLERVSHVREGYRISEDEAKPGRHPYHAAGVYYLQDPSAMAVGALTGASPGERVLDLSAAPGGKATHLAARMNNSGVLVANDISRARAGELSRSLERCGVTNAVVTCERPERLAEHFDAYFDRVLVDAPCSGESMFHKSPAALADWSQESVLGCARRQAEILADAGRMVAPGGLLIYSTCTFSEEENEAVAVEFIAENAAFEPSPLPDWTDAEPVRLTAQGRVETPGVDSSAHAPIAGTVCGYRLWPHKVPGAGHFVVAFRKSADDTAGKPHPSTPTDDVPRARREALELLDRFVREAFRDLTLETQQIAQSGEELFLLPAGSPSTKGLCTVRRGVWLGSARRGRFEPSHAFALSIPPAAAVSPVELTATDPRTKLYLSGHPIDDAGEPGWTPVCVDGFALGWGKRVGRTVKNHYPKGLRLPA